MIREPRSGCPINRALEAVGDRWSLVILRDVLAYERRGFRELLTQNEEKISAPVLSRRLKDLVEAGILTKKASPRGTPGAYEATPLGRRVVPVLDAMADFGIAIDPETARHPLVAGRRAADAAAPDQSAAPDQTQGAPS